MNCWKRDNVSKQVLKCDFQEVLDFLNNNNLIECDTETTGLDPHINDILCIQFGNPNQQYLIEWGTDLVSPLTHIFEDNSKTFIFQNAKFDLQFFYKYGIIVNNIYDTFLAECVLTCGTLAERNLLAIANKYLGVDLSKTIRSLIPKLGLTAEVISYGLDDVKYLTLIKEQQEILIEKYNLEKTVELDNKFVKALAYVEYCGMGFDPELWGKNIKENIETEKELLNKLNHIVINNKIKKFYNYADLFCENPVFVDGIGYNSTINWGSPKQVIELFKEIGIDVSITEEGEIKESVGKGVLQQKKDEHPIINIYSEYIKNRKLLTSFGDKYFKFINPVTNRIHTSYKQILNTGRMSSGNKNDNKPNLQQLPADSRYRKCFISEPNNVLIASDYSGMESVVFANKTMDKGLLEFYDKGLGDMHSYIASMCFKDQLEGIELNDIKKKRPDLRQNAKGAGFAIQFGGVGFTISNNLGISLEEGEAVYAAYMRAFPEVNQYFTQVHQQTLKDGYITFNDVTNRKSFFDFLPLFEELKEFINKIDWTQYRVEKANNSPLYQNVLKDKVKNYFKLSGMLQRRSLNYPVQGTSADITKIAVMKIFDYIIENKLFNIVKICNIVHDEVIVECPEEMQETMAKVIKQCMVDAGKVFYTRVPLDASCDIGKYWIH